MKIGEKIREERKKKGMTQKELSNLMGLKNSQTVYAIESGTRILKANELPKIAKALGVAVSYLLGKEKEKEKEILWRGCRDRSLCKKVEKRLIQFCRNFEEISDLLGHKYERFVPPRPEELQKERYRITSDFSIHLANKYRKILDLGRYPANNLIDSLQSENILIFCFDLKEFASAASMVGSFGAAILLNKNSCPCLNHFNIAHELFYLITWEINTRRSISSHKEGKIGRELIADAFASTLLLPRDSIRDEYQNWMRGREGTLIDFLEIAAKFKIPIEALIRDTEARFFYMHPRYREVTKSIMNYKKIDEINKFLRYNETELPALPEIYVMKALKAFQLGMISKKELGDYLDTEEIGEFLKQYSYKMEGVKLESLLF